MMSGKVVASGKIPLTHLNINKRFICKGRFPPGVCRISGMYARVFKVGSQIKILTSGVEFQGRHSRNMPSPKRQAQTPLWATSPLHNMFLTHTHSHTDVCTCTPKTHTVGRQFPAPFLLLLFSLYPPLNNEKPLHFLRGHSKRSALRKNNK